jgi:hypothetical protein
MKVKELSETQKEILIESLMIAWAREKWAETLKNDDAEIGILYSPEGDISVTLEILGRTHSQYSLEDISKFKPRKRLLSSIKLNENNPRYIKDKRFDKLKFKNLNK